MTWAVARPAATAWQQAYVRAGLGSKASCRTRARLGLAFLLNGKPYTLTAGARGWAWLSPSHRPVSIACGACGVTRCRLCCVLHLPTQVPSDAFTVGQVVRARVLSVDPLKRRLKLSLAAKGAAPTDGGAAQPGADWGEGGALVAGGAVRIIRAPGRSDTHQSAGSQ